MKDKINDFEATRHSGKNSSICSADAFRICGQINEKENNLKKESDQIVKILKSKVNSNWVKR